MRRIIPFACMLFIISAVWGQSFALGEDNLQPPGPPPSKPAYREVTVPFSEADPYLFYDDGREKLISAYFDQLYPGVPEEQKRELVLVDSRHFFVYYTDYPFHLNDDAEHTVYYEFRFRHRWDGSIAFLVWVSGNCEHLYAEDIDLSSELRKLDGIKVSHAQAIAAVKAEYEKACSRHEKEFNAFCKAYGSENAVFENLKLRTCVISYENDLHWIVTVEQPLYEHPVYGSLANNIWMVADVSASTGEILDVGDEGLFKVSNYLFGYPSDQ